MDKHTPGTWAWVGPHPDGSLTLVKLTTGRIIGRFEPAADIGPDEAKANLALIDSAPDLLGTLNTIGTCSEREPFDGDLGHRLAMGRIARAAIRNATPT